jgi:hypothetical protein
MTYEFTAERERTYLHVTGRGEHTAEHLRQLLLDAYRSAIEHGCDTLLIELNFTGPSLSVGTIYSVVSERSGDGAQLRHIVWVDKDPGHHERAEFAEAAARKLGVSVQFFPNLEEARRSLQEWQGGPGRRTGGNPPR